MVDLRSSLSFIAFHSHESLDCYTFIVVLFGFVGFLIEVESKSLPTNLNLSFRKFGFVPTEMEMRNPYISPFFACYSLVIVYAL